MLPGNIKRGRLPEPNEAGEGESESMGRAANTVQFRVICAMIWRKNLRSPREVYVISHFHYEEVCGGRGRKERRRGEGNEKQL